MTALNLNKNMNISLYVYILCEADFSFRQWPNILVDLTVVVGNTVVLFPNLVVHGEGEGHAPVYRHVLVHGVHLLPGQLNLLLREK
jgi:hypothetical protein